MKKLYFENEYNNCTCTEPRDHARVPAEKPFESRPKRKVRYGEGETGKERRKTRESPQKRRPKQYGEAPIAYQPILPGYCLYCTEPQYKPNLRLSFERVDKPPQKQVSVLNQRNTFCVREYSSNTSDEQQYEQKRCLAGQYPCSCLQPNIQYEGTPDMKYFQSCNCTFLPKSYNGAKDSPSRGKRAWNMLKSKTKRMFNNSKSKTRSEKQRQYAMRGYYEPCGSPYVYPYPVQFTPCRTSSPGNRSQAMGTHANASSSGNVCIYRESTTEEERSPSPKEVPQAQMPSQHVTRENCCCVCDVDYCNCKCCCTGQCTENGMFDVHQNTQTSMQNIKECFTQTDFPKRCCRCCRCCARKSKCYTTPLPGAPSDDPTYTGQCVGCKNCLYKEGPCPPTANFSCPGQKDVSPAANPTGLKSTNEVPKTQMVKTNCVQCIPVSENKATSCDEHFTATRMNDLLKDLWDGKYDVVCDKKLKSNIGDTSIYQNAIEWTDKFLKSVTSPKKFTSYLMNDGVFSSPLSGRSYNLGLHDVRSSSKITERYLPKPLDISSDVFNKKLPKRFYHSYGEHHNLISAICDAILSKHDDDIDIGRSQFVCKDDLCSDQNLHVRTQGDSEQIKTDEKKPIHKEIHEEAKVVSKVASKPKCSYSKKSTSKQNSPGLIPVRTTKRQMEKIANRKKIGSEISERASSVDSNEGSNERCVKKKDAMDGEPSNLDKINYYVSESRDLYGKLHSKYFSKDSEKCNTTSENQKGNSPIDYDRLKDLDFSSIRFSKSSTETNENASDFFRQKYMNQQNFILNNLPAYSSSISNEYQIKSLLLNGDITIPRELLEKSGCPFFQPPGSSNLLDIRKKIHPKLEERLATMGPYERKEAEKRIETMLAEIEENKRMKQMRDAEFFGKKSG